MRLHLRGGVAYLDLDFDKLCHSLSFLEVLERFSRPKTVADHLEAIESRLHDEFIRAVSYLLRTGHLVQVREFPVLALEDPPYPSQGAATASEVAALAHHIENEAPRELVIRYSPLFRGAADLDEICWRTGMDRVNLQSFLKAFSAFIFTYERT